MVVKLRYIEGHASGHAQCFSITPPRGKVGLGASQVLLTGGATGAQTPGSETDREGLGLFTGIYHGGEVTL